MLLQTTFRGRPYSNDTNSILIRTREVTIRTKEGDNVHFKVYKEREESKCVGCKDDVSAVKQIMKQRKNIVEIPCPDFLKTIQYEDSSLFI
jgi:hypothetical protein